MTARCDVHRHLGGSISVDTVWSIIQESGCFHVASNRDQVKHRMTFSHTTARDFNIFLDKFTILDEIPWTQWGMDLAVKQIVNDLHTDCIDCSLLSLSIDKYLRYGWTIEGIVEFFSRSFKDHGGAYGTDVRLLLAIRYDSDRERQKRIASLIESPELSSAFYGIDLVGNEAAMDEEFHTELLRPWANAGKLVRAHVGELPGTCPNIDAAVRNMPITNIAHGIYGDPYIWKQAVKRGLYFDLAIHSNLFTGSVASIETHPFRKMLDVGCMVTLSTDDPVQFEVSLDDEFNAAGRYLQEAELEQLRRNAARICGLD